MSRPAILVIGGAGYIGSHMVLDLIRAGYPVITLGNHSRGHRDSVVGGEFVEGDLGSPGDLDRLFTRYPVKAVMHFAAWSLVGESVEQPLAYWRNNVANTLTLLESMQRHGIRHFIFSSTAAVYGEPQHTPNTEAHPCSPTNPYGATKLAVARLLADVSAASGPSFSILRYFNAAGADAGGSIGERHQPETHLIPLVLQVATGEREAISVFGEDYPTSDGTCLRDYIHVSDLTRAHLLALEALLGGRQYDPITWARAPGIPSGRSSMPRGRSPATRSRSGSRNAVPATRPSSLPTRAGFAANWVGRRATNISMTSSAPPGTGTGRK